MDAMAIAETRAQMIPWGPAREVENPWVADEILLNLSIWWVKATRPDSPDFMAEVAAVFSSLDQELRLRTGVAARRASAAGILRSSSSQDRRADTT